jgi:hypothetical protein
VTFTPARVEDVTLERDEMVAAGFLVRYREPTRNNYTRNLRQWFSWCQQRGVAPLKATRAHIEVYARELEELRGLKVSSVANKLNTIAGFYKFARIDHYIDEDPAEYVRRPTVPRGRRASPSHAPRRCAVSTSLRRRRAPPTTRSGACSCSTVCASARLWLSTSTTSVARVATARSR